MYSSNGRQPLQDFDCDFFLSVARWGKTVGSDPAPPLAEQHGCSVAGPWALVWDGMSKIIRPQMKALQETQLDTLHMKEKNQIASYCLLEMSKEMGYQHVCIFLLTLWAQFGNDFDGLTRRAGSRSGTLWSEMLFQLQC